jgi:hypothetical protein
MVNHEECKMHQIRHEWSRKGVIAPGMILLELVVKCINFACFNENVMTYE